MLHATTILHSDGISIADVACRHERGRGHEDECPRSHAIVFIRRGCFVRVTSGARTVLDPTLAYATNPGDVQRYDHPHGHGDDCTAVTLEPNLLASLWGGDPMLPAQGVRVPPGLDVAHRMLLADGRLGDDAHELVERTIGLVAAALAQVDAPRVAAGRPATAAARRALVDGVREALAEDDDRALPELARLVGASPHHLSRTFKAHTGHSISRHRMRLRTRQALERLAGGEEDLARLAADLRLADQSHLTRILRAETGLTPAALRRRLRR